MLKVLEVYMKKCGNRNRKYAKCICECGNIFELRYDSLKITKSCGCLKKEQDKINLTKHHSHKLTGTKLWNTYYGMLSRCYRNNDKRYNDYGGRGIKVCEEWKNSFEEFVKWSFENSFVDSEEYSIDRIDNNLGYSPDNCRWTTRKAQCRNRRSNTIIYYEGEYITLIELSEKTGIPYSLIRERYNRGNNLEEILTKGSLPKGTKSKGEKRPNSKLKECDVLEMRKLSKEGVSYRELGERYNVSKSTVSAIINRKMWKHI